MPKPLLALASLALAMPAAALAQDADEAADDSYNMVIVYGDDECPQSTTDQIVVCARKAENERFRIPENLPAGDYVLGWRWDCEQSTQVSFAFLYLLEQILATAALPVR